MKKKSIVVIALVVIVAIIGGSLYSMFNFDPQKDSMEIFDEFYTSLNETDQQIEVLVYEGNSETSIEYANNSDSYKLNIDLDEDNYFYLETNEDGTYKNLEYVVEGEDDVETFETLYPDGSGSDYVFTMIYSLKYQADIDSLYESFAELNSDTFEKDGQYIIITSENDDSISYELKSDGSEFIKSYGDEYKIIFKIK